MCVVGVSNSLQVSAACQAPLSRRFSRQEYWSGMPRSTPWDLPNPGIKLTSLVSPALAGRFFTTSTTCELLLHEDKERTKPQL